MNQKIFNNIILLLIIIALITYISPSPDSVLFIIKKYLNFLIFKIKNFILQIFNYDLENFKMTEMNLGTFKGMQQFIDKAPSFITARQISWTEDLLDKNPLIKPSIAKKLYHFIESLVSIDVDDYFISASNKKKYKFNENELETIINVIMNNLNSNEFKFTELKILKHPTYRKNISGKEVDPFYFSVICDNNIGQVNIYIEINIRNDVRQNLETISIKKITLLSDTISSSPPSSSSVSLSNNQPFYLSKNKPIKNIPKINDGHQNNWANIDETYEINYNNINMPNYDDNNTDVYSEYNNIIKNQEIKVASNTSNSTNVVSNNSTNGVSNNSINGVSNNSTTGFSSNYSNDITNNSTTGFSSNFTNDLTNNSINKFSSNFTNDYTNDYTNDSNTQVINPTIFKYSVDNDIVETPLNNQFSINTPIINFNQTFTSDTSVIPTSENSYQPNFDYDIVN